MSPIKQRGTALIVALFIVALVAAIAFSMMERLSRDLKRTELFLNSVQAELYAEGSLSWAADTLCSHWLHQEPNQRLDQLPLALGPTEKDHYIISSRISDAQAYFNINNLSLEAWSPLFLNLLLHIDPELTLDKAQALIASIKSSLTSQPLAEISELKLIKGISPELYLKLLPTVIALPRGTLININSASAPVLQSLSPTLSAESAKAIVSYREQKPFANISDFMHWELTRNHGLPENQLTVNSEYFLIQTKVEKGQQQLLLTTLVQRMIKNGKPVILVLWQAKGV